jgi:hypothetical protein
MSTFMKSYNVSLDFPSYDQNVQLILKNYLPVVYGTSLWFEDTKG